MRQGACARALCAGVLWLAATCGWAAPAALSMREVASGVHVHLGALEEWGPANGGDVGNLGFVVGERCVAVIDTGGTAAIGRALLAAVRQVTALPVCHVINTHAHPDHVLGNEAFAVAKAAAASDRPGDEPDPKSAATTPAGPEFIGHERLPAALRARGPFYLRALARDFGPAREPGRIVEPTRTVQGTLELDLGGRILRLQAWPTAHTDADLSVRDLRTGTLFLGDLLFRAHTPVVDGRLRGWLAVMARLGQEPVRLAVPGHGEPTGDWPGALQPQQRYLEKLQSDVRAALKAGWTMSQAVERNTPEPGPWQLLDVFHARNVTAAYAELEWED